MASGCTGNEDSKASAVLYENAEGRAKSHASYDRSMDLWDTDDYREFLGLWRGFSVDFEKEKIVII